MPMENSINEKEEPEFIRSYFKESKEAKRYLHMITDQPEVPLKEKETAYENFTILIKQYQEQPSLLDSDLEYIVTHLLRTLKTSLLQLSKINRQRIKNYLIHYHHHHDVLGTEEETNNEDAGLLHKLWFTSAMLYTVCVVRRPKATINLFLTEVALVDLILSSIEDLLEITFGFANGLTDDEYAQYGPIVSVNGKDRPSPLRELAEPSLWRLHYVLMVWLSILVLTPFQFLDFGKKKFIENKSEIEMSIPQRFLIVITTSLRYTYAIQQATALVVARLCCRPDVFQSQIPIDFLNWSSEHFRKSENPQCLTIRIGVLLCLKATLKQASHLTLKTILKPVFDLLMIQVPSENAIQFGSADTLVAKLYTSCIGRLALHYVQTKPASWRHVQRHRKLDFKNQTLSPDHIRTSDDDLMDDDENNMIGPEVETLLDFFLERLEDKNTGIRWVSAKAVGRITQRLPFEYANQVVESVLELVETSFQKNAAKINQTNPQSSESSESSFEQIQFIQNEEGCHGGSLALAELTRRGCVKISHVHQVISLLCQVTKYEPYGLGGGRLGSAIRDAACFVCWSIARAYSSEVIVSRSHEMIEALLIIALFDRDVNCRRAASASIQEIIGRQREFPNGIPIVTIADYYGLATMRSSFLRVSPLIAQFEEYRQSIVKHLVNVKLRHSERCVRELAARSLKLISSHCDVEDLEVILKLLEHRALNGSVEDRHGALLGISSIISNLSDRQLSFNQVNDSFIKKLRNIILKLEKNRAYRGRGGELTREAVCRLIGSLSSATSWIPYQANTSQRYFQTIQDCLKNFVDHVQLAAAEAFQQLASTRATNEQLDFWTSELLSALKNKHENIAARRGLCLALGLLPWKNSSLANRALEVLMFFCEEAVSHHPNSSMELRDPLMRQAAMICIPFVLRPLKEFYQNPSLQLTMDQTSLYEKVCRTIEIAGVDDQYDRRGDVGSWVREGAIEVAAFILENHLIVNIPQGNHHSSVCVSQGLPLSTFLSTQQNLLQTEMIQRLLSCLLRQTVDKLDRTRGRAVFLCYRFFTLLSKQLREGKKNVSLLQPEWIFYRAFYSYPYEILCARVDESEDMTFPSANCGEKNVCSSSCQSLKKFETVFNAIAKSGKTEVVLSQRGLGAQSLLAPKTFTNRLSENDDYELDEAVCMEAIGSFVSWNSYNYATQRFQKAGVTLKIPQFNRADIVIPSVLSLLQLGDKLGMSILAGVTNAAGASLGFVSNAASSALISVLQRQKHGTYYYYYYDQRSPMTCNQFDVNNLTTSAESEFENEFNENRFKQSTDVETPNCSNLVGWVSRLLCFVGIMLIEKDQGCTVKKVQLLDGKVGEECLVTFQGVCLHSILKTIALLLENDVFDLHSLNAFLPMIYSTLKKSSDIATLKASIDVSCAVITSSSADESSQKKPSRTSEISQSFDLKRLRTEALISSVKLGLAHRYPLIRQHTSEKLISRFLMVTDEELKILLDPGSDFLCSKFQEVLLEVPWSSCDDASNPKNSLPGFFDLKVQEVLAMFNFN